MKSQAKLELDSHTSGNKRGSQFGCPVCFSTQFIVVNYDPVWKDGEVRCNNGHFVRNYDAG
jgi:hypothetical protein